MAPFRVHEVKRVWLMLLRLHKQPGHRRTPLAFIAVRDDSEVDEGLDRRVNKPVGCSAAPAYGIGHTPSSPANTQQTPRWRQRSRLGTEPSPPIWANSQSLPPPTSQLAERERRFEMSDDCDRDWRAKAATCVECTKCRLRYYKAALEPQAASLITVDALIAFLRRSSARRRPQMTAQ